MGDDEKTCKEIDACAADVSPCSKYANCKKTGPGLFNCTCWTGYFGDGKSCAEIDMCLKKPCDEHATCLKTGPGTYKCVPKKGYEFAKDGKTVVEINPCQKAPYPCAYEAYCNKTGPGEFKCTCKEGYSGGGYKCHEINHCDDHPSPCSTHATCTYNGPGKYICACNLGYQGDGVYCALPIGFDGDSAECAECEDKHMLQEKILDVSLKLDALNQDDIDDKDEEQDALIADANTRISDLQGLKARLRRRT
jgi:hypothetical protein